VGLFGTVVGIKKMKNRKAAIRAFKERKVARGTFAVRCPATSQVWVGSAPNLDAWRNSLWFTLRNGTHPNQELQRQWNAQGEQAFTYEILETVGDDVSPLALNDLLKEKKLAWKEKLGALLV